LTGRVRVTTFRSDVVESIGASIVHHRRVRLAIRAAIALAAACAFGAAPAILSPASAQGASVTEEMVRRVVPRGARSIIWRSYGLNPDCTTLRGFTLEIERLPRHGRVVLEKVERTIDRTFFTHRVSPRQAAILRGCIGRTVPIIAAFYTARSGYSGFDDLSLRTTSVDGRRQFAVEVRIAVR
jgi:hypothetical protein